jgi:preprotein translocase subunit SecG
MDTAINIAMIVISIVLIFVILMQSGNSSFTGDTSSIHRTRRGVERTLFNLAIGTGVVFVIMAIISSFR